jgi:hypothetical protein
LLRGPENPMPWLRGILKSFRCSILNYSDTSVAEHSRV